MCLSVDLHYRQAYNLERADINGETEVLVSKLDVPMPFELFYESDIWIGDSGAPSHSTNNETGAVNEREFGQALVTPERL